MIVATICIFLAVQTPVLSMQPTESPDVDGQINLSVSEAGNLTVELAVDISRAYYRQPVFLSLEHLDVEQTDCLSSTGLTVVTHRVSSECTDLSVTAHRNITTDISQGTSVGYVQQNNFLIKQQLSVISVSLSPLDDAEEHSLYSDTTVSMSGFYASNDTEHIAENGLIYAGNAPIETARHENDTIQVVGSEPESGAGDLARAIDQHAVVPEDGHADTVTLFVFPRDTDSSAPRAYNFPGNGSYVGLHYYGGSAVLTASADMDTAFHEYVHSQENSYQTSPQMDWIEEGQATYYGSLSAHNASRISTLQLHGRYPAHEPNKDAILSNRSDWAQSTEYQKGQAVLAGLDSCIQKQTQDKTLADVFTQLYELNQTVTVDRFNQIIYEETGLQAELWLEAYTDTANSPQFDDGNATICPTSINNRMREDGSVTLTEVIETERETTQTNDDST